MKRGIGDWGLGIGDWGLGIGDWALAPIPNPQSPIPNPQSPIPNPQRQILKEQKIAKTNHKIHDRKSEDLNNLSRNKDIKVLLENKNKAEGFLRGHLEKVQDVDWGGEI